MFTRHETTIYTVVPAVLLSAACGDDDASGGETSGTETDGGTTSGTAGEHGTDPAPPEGATDTGPGSTGFDASSSSSSGLEPEGCRPDPICPEDAPVLGEPGQTVTESLEVEFGSSEACGPVSPVYYVRVPEDTVGVSVTIDHSDAWSAFTHLSLEGDILIDAQVEGFGGWGAPPTKHLPNPAASVVFPMSPETVPRAGCLAVQVDTDGSIDVPGTLSFTTRRAMGQGLLDLELVVVGDTDIAEAELLEVVERVDALYVEGNAATVNAVDVRFLDSDTAIFDAEGPELAALRRGYVPSNPHAMTVFFVSDLLIPGLLGIAGGVPGPNGIGPAESQGVLISVDSHRYVDGSIALDLLSTTIAHEMGHQFGLFHTTESDGSEHDLAPDTPECSATDDIDADGALIASECPDGANFMFWTAAEDPQSEVSPFQSDVLFYSPIVR